MISKIMQHVLAIDSGASSLQHDALSDDALAAVVGGNQNPDGSSFEPPPLIDPPTFGNLYAGLLALDAERDAEREAAERDGEG